MQITVSANLQAAAMAGSAALTELLREATPAQVGRCRTHASMLLMAFRCPLELVHHLQKDPSAAPLVQKFWQRVVEHPSALAAEVEAGRACRDADSALLEYVVLVTDELQLHVEYLRPSQNGTTEYHAAWEVLMSSDSLQQFVMDAIPTLQYFDSSSSTRLPAAKVARSLKTITWFLCFAAVEGKLSAARLSTLLTHELIIAPIRALAEGSTGAESIIPSITVLEAGWEGRCSPGGSPAAHRAAQSAVLGALRQTAALLQLQALPAAQRQRAVRRARRGGFLQVRL